MLLGASAVSRVYDSQISSTNRRCLSACMTKPTWSHCPILKCPLNSHARISSLVIKLLPLQPLVFDFGSMSIADVHLVADDGGCQSSNRAHTETRHLHKTETIQGHDHKGQVEQPSCHPPSLDLAGAPHASSR